MPIVSSTHAVGHAQIDGRRYVEETHTDELGAKFVRTYGPVHELDYVAVRTSYAQQFNDQLAEAEAAALIGNES